MRKICTFMALLAVLFLYTGTSFATGLLTEDFNYTAGDSLTAHGWVAHSGSGGIAVTSPGLTYSGYLGSGIGLAATYTNATTVDMHKDFSSPVSSGTLYASAMINITTTAATNTYFLHFGTGNTTTFSAKLFAKPDGAGYDFGITKAANTPTTWTSTCTYGTTYFVVIKYTYVGGATNDVVDLFLNPTPGGSEPAVTITAGDPTGTDAGTMSWVGVRQANGIPSTTVDGIRAGTVWGDVTPASTPSLSAVPGTVSGLTYIVGAGPSPSMSYTLNGVNLTGAPGDITVSASTNFQVSNDNSSWSSTSVPVHYTSATLSAPVYVRLKSGLPVATYGPENIANAGGGATTMNVPTSGFVDAAQQLTVSVPSITGLNYFFGSGPSAPQSYNLSGSSLTGYPGNITVTGSDTFKVCLTSGGTYANSVSVPYSSATLASTPIYVKLVAGLANGSYGPKNITNAGGGASTENVAVSGSVVTQTLTLSYVTFVNLSYFVGGGPSVPTTFSIAGANLSGYPGDITVTAPSNFQVSNDSSSWGSSTTVAYTSGTLAATKVWARLAGGLGIGTYGPGTLSFAGGGAATQNATLTGSVAAVGNLLLSDDFSYALDTLNGQDGWVAHSSIGFSPMTVTSPGLTYTGLSGSGVGNAVTMFAAGGEDCNHQFTNIPLTGSGTVYASAMVNVQTATATGDYFIHFSDGGTYSFYARTFVQSSGAGFKFGISKYNGVKAYTSTVYNFNQTYLVVIKYTSVAGATNDYANLWVNPATGGSEPAADLTSDAILLDASNISGVFLRQGSSSAAPGLQVDGIKAGLTWESVTPAAGCTLNLTAVLEAMWVAGGETAMTMTPSVTVELHDASTYALIEAKTGTLSLAGAGSFTFTSAANGTPYFIVVKSANTIEVWSAAAQSFTAGALTYNFTTGTAQAYTDGSNPSLAVHSGTYCIYSGDVNQDGFVTGDDFEGVDNDAANFDFHVATDVNGDSFVTGDDFQFIDNNAALFVQRQVPPGAPSHLVKRAVKSNVQHKSSVN